MIPEFVSSPGGSAKDNNLSFVSPLRMLKKIRKKGDRYFDPQHFDCEQFFELLLLRVQKDLPGLEISAEELSHIPECSLKSKTLIWVDMPKPNKTTLGGVLGKVKFRTSLSPFWERLLWFGQFIHAGNNTSFGFGKYFVDNYNLTPDIKPDKNFLELILNDANLTEAFYETKENAGGAGIDRVTLDEYETSLNDNLDKTRFDITAGKYKPDNLLGVILPKESGRIRALAIPTVKDRIFQRAVVRTISRSIDRLLEESSFAHDLDKLKERAEQTGIPYQMLINSILSYYSAIIKAAFNLYCCGKKRRSKNFSHIFSVKTQL